MKKENKKELKSCAECGKDFPKKENKKFCSPFCRFKNWAKNHPRIKII